MVINSLRLRINLFKFTDDGCVILKMIAVTILTKMKRPVLDVTDHVLNLNSGVTMTSVYQADGNVIMMTIAETEVMKHHALPIRVEMTNSNALPVTVSKKV